MGFCWFCWASVCVGSFHHLGGEILSFSQQSSVPAWEEQKCIIKQAAKKCRKCNQTPASCLFPEDFSSVLSVFSKPWRWTSPCTVITSKLIYYHRGKKTQVSGAQVRELPEQPGYLCKVTLKYLKYYILKSPQGVLTVGAPHFLVPLLHLMVNTFGPWKSSSSTWDLTVN